MIQLFKNENITTQFSRINGGCHTQHIPFEKPFYMEFEGALRACKVMREVLNCGLKENGGTLLKGVGYEIKIAGIKTTEIFWERLPELFLTPQDYENRRISGKYVCPFPECTFTNESVLRSFGFSVQNAIWMEKYVAKFFYNEKYSKAELMAVTINALWCDKDGWHIDFDEPAGIKLYSTEKECYEDNQIKVIDFDDETDEMAEQEFEITTIVKVKARTRQDAEIKVKDIICNVKTLK